MYDDREDKDDLVNDEEFRPFVTIWLRPRDTVRLAIREKPMGLIYTLVILTAILETLVNAYDNDLPFSLSYVIIIFACILLAMLSVLGWLFMSWMYAVVGGWLGGSGQTDNMRVAIGISYIPALVSSALGVFALLLLEMTYYSVLSTFTALFISFIVIVLAVWTIVTQVKAIAEVHGFSAWRGLGTFLLAGLIIGVIVFIIIMVIFIFLIAVFA